MRTDKTLNQLVREFVNDRDVLPETRKRHTQILDRWFKWLIASGADPRAPEKINFYEYARELEKTKQKHTAKKYFCIVSLFYRFCRREDYFEDITENARRIKTDYKSRMKASLTESEAKLLLRNMPKETVNNLRDYAMVKMMLITGFRRAEVSSIRVDDLFVEKGCWKVSVKRKGHLSKTVIGIPIEVVASIREYWSLRKPFDKQSFAFVNHCRSVDECAISDAYISRMSKRALYSIGLTDKAYSCHSFRHTTAQIAIDAGESIWDVRDLLGHQDVRSTEIYLRSSEARRKSNNIAVRSTIKALIESD